jgi:hypothetical protein
MCVTALLDWAFFAAMLFAVAVYVRKQWHDQDPDAVVEPGDHMAASRQSTSLYRSLYPQPPTSHGNGPECPPVGLIDATVDQMGAIIRATPAELAGGEWPGRDEAEVHECECEAMAEPAICRSCHVIHGRLQWIRSPIVLREYHIAPREVRCVGSMLLREAADGQEHDLRRFFLRDACLRFAKLSARKLD